MKKFHDALEPIGGCSSAVIGPSSIDEIIPGLYLGGKPSINHKTVLNIIISIIIIMSELVRMYDRVFTCKYIFSSLTCIFKQLISSDQYLSSY